jgi:Xaa-Pro aminopeptidase
MHSSTEQKVTQLREWMTNQHLDAIIVPHEDEYLGEYIPAHNERLHWLTGFTGSAGAAVITQTSAAMFVDGRYTVQVKDQVPSSVFDYCHLITEPPVDWIASNLSLGSKIGIDPSMHSGAWFKSATRALAGNFELTVLEDNPIDALWLDRPTGQFSDVRLMTTEQVGMSSAQKRQDLSQAIANNGADAVVITALDSICWLLNVRGLDVSRLPVILSHVVLNSDGSAIWFIDSSRVPSGFDQHVGGNVEIKEPSALSEHMTTLSGKTVQIDAATANAWFSLELDKAGATVLNLPDPCLLPKARKNDVERQGMIDCHVRDGVAMVKFLSWLDGAVEQGELYNEAELADKLEGFRREDPTLVDLSFDTISAAGSNAAMCHYNHLNQDIPGTLTPNSLYLVDSGGQYLDGTTDITRTIAIGTPTGEMKKQFTLALKGHIGIARARFPNGTCGYQIDSFARQHLWAQGYDFDHGTGHGVGHFLSVHEGPQSISKRQINVALEEGMVLSNEPGYYREDAFGIRIENLELVVLEQTDGDFPVLTFQSLTRCPIDLRNVVVELLSEEELAWLNDYHQKVWADLSPLVSGDVKSWLKKATQALTR